MKALSFFLAGSLLLAPCALLPAAERVAIVIGNSVYDPQQPLPKPTDPKDPGNPNLPNPVNDAALVHATFKNLGFTLILAAETRPSRDFQPYPCSASHGSAIDTATKPNEEIDDANARQQMTCDFLTSFSVQIFD